MSFRTHQRSRQIKGTNQVAAGFAMKRDNYRRLRFRPRRGTPNSAGFAERKAYIANPAQKRE